MGDRLFLSEDDAPRSRHSSEARHYLLEALFEPSASLSFIRRRFPFMKEGICSGGFLVCYMEEGLSLSLPVL